ncbi:GAF and ANTAR domain-containing protein [Streptomyces sp. NPDC059785]|uniref:GAF and ANTAR domain-containing protein n=1 Tax=Streptomyces sp. NPDC059785 TaxID=3346945 RepID=UPI0036647CB2
MESARPDHPGPSGEGAGEGSADGGARAARRLAELLRAGASGHEEAPARLCRACVEMLGMGGASISLSGGGTTRTVWWSSDPVAGRLAEAQYTLGDGPCQSALAELAPVQAADLARSQDALRWPLFAQQAVELNVRAVFSLPLGSDTVAIGTLDLYREAPGPLSAADTAFAVSAADAITTSLLVLQTDAAQSGAPPSWWLSAAETDHEEVHQATGMIMIYLGLDAPTALARLRAHAFAHGQSVSEAALDVIAGKIDFHD